MDNNQQFENAVIILEAILQKMDNNQQFENAVIILEAILQKIVDVDEDGLHLTMEEATLFRLWLTEAGLMK